MSSRVNTSPSSHDRCITCLCSFGIQVERIPCKCVNPKCGRQFCAQCIKQIQIYNGSDRAFRCMYCLMEYRGDSIPEENQLLIQQLWDEHLTQYGLKHTGDILTSDCTVQDFLLDIDCRRRHLMNLVSLYKRFCGRNPFLLTIEYTVNQLNDLATRIKRNQNDTLAEYKTFYRRLLSTGMNETDFGLLYISLCERLQLEISEAEYCSLFPKTNAKINDWLHEQGSANEFQPKIFDLYQVIEQDLTNQWSNPYLATRTKIGVIGHTSSGKSSLINRLLGVKSLAEDDAAPVSSKKGTYFPLQFDRRDPLHATKILITFVDIQGVENEETREGSYLDIIRKADCDIYLLVSDERLHDEHYGWLAYIEEVLKRKCLVIRSKIDKDYLQKFQELTGIPFDKSERDQRLDLEPSIREQIKQDHHIESQTVYLVACDYHIQSNSAAMLLKDQSFDLTKLLDDLGGLAFDACSSRIHGLANRIIARAINTIFRRGYVLNVMKYKVAAGFASVIPFGDQLPRYLSRDSIREVFGIDDSLRQYLSEFHLIVYNYKLQTSVFEECVEIRETQNNSKLDARWIGRTAGTALLVGSGFTEDILRVAAPTATALSGAARAAFTVTTFGIGLVISAGVSAWSAIDSGKHIFSYINRVSDDIIMISDALIKSIIELKQGKVSERDPPAPTVIADVDNSRWYI